jgi:thiamine biosynthesis lipoprotein
VDYRGIEIGAAAVRLARPGMAVTLNGIAQGYITDRVAELLAEAGMPHALVDAGELRALGDGPDGAPWRVAVAHPATPVRTIGLAGAAIATSAGRGSPFTADGRVHHILDPRTGACPPPDRAASVIAPGATAADALATALTLLANDDPLAAKALRAAGGARAILSEAGGTPWSREPALAQARRDVAAR